MSRMYWHGSTVAEIKIQEPELGEMLETATLTMTPWTPPANGPTTAAPDQAELPITDHRGPHHDHPSFEFEVAGTIMLSVPVRIACRSSSPEWASKLIRKIFTGEISAPPGFSVEVDTEYLEALHNNLDIASTSNYPFQTIDAQELIITSIKPRLLIEGRAA